MCKDKKLFKSNSKKMSKDKKNYLRLINLLCNTIHVRHFIQIYAKNTIWIIEVPSTSNR